MDVSRMLEVVPYEGIAGHPPADGLAALGPQDLAQHRPDAHVGIVAHGRLEGRCSLWWSETPAHCGRRVGFIGHYAVSSGAAAAGLLDYACGRLAQAGCSLAAAPIDGNTWRNYRLITEFGCEPRFLFEPDHPAEWPDHFRAAGFEPLAHYFSALNTDLAFEDPGLKRTADRLFARGIVVRPMDAERFDEELRGFFPVATAAFRGHLLFSSLEETEFLQQYRRLRETAPCDLTLAAQHDERLVGFVFAVPDLLQRRRGEPVDTVIVKSLAVLPGHAYAGLGQLLLARVQQRSLQRGFRRAIHALMLDSPTMRRLSGRYARPIRGYTLFAKALQA
jgi:GNAT superfamily N-acetyltransferase